ncbi:unnamed protein product [Vitrella brassicaformis CCMP3155]|uniref:Uncharacterized protein n=1 Tax=Vitrella brassicaformis (strain CCMP3155) TaxID=1169540 RepID=A0A0G4FC32_VITBC|nr:unnamed protein product [Vitrella brassicaformis CCMP3155]|eukprot:CEM10757.1 unnamed protein product [Vitrella brassicaformis CCMP3155]
MFCCCFPRKSSPAQASHDGAARWFGMAFMPMLMSMFGAAAGSKKKAAEDRAVKELAYSHLFGYENRRQRAHGLKAYLMGRMSPVGAFKVMEGMMPTVNINKWLLFSIHVTALIFGPEAIDDKAIEEQLTLLIAVFGHDLMRALTLVVQGALLFTPLDNVQEWPKGVMEMADMVAVWSRLCVGNVMTREEILNAFDALAMKEIIDDITGTTTVVQFIRECGVCVSNSEATTSEGTKAHVSRAESASAATEPDNGYERDGATYYDAIEG